MASVIGRTVGTSAVRLLFMPSVFKAILRGGSNFCVTTKNT